MAAIRAREIPRMKYANWMWLAFLLSVPAQAADMDFQGYAIEAEGPASGRQILRVQGKRYAIPGTPAQVVGKAQGCLSQRDSRAGVVSVDADGGRLVAVSRVEYRDGGGAHLARGWLTVDAGDGAFGVALSKIGVLQASSGDAADEVFLPLGLDGGAGWEPALAAVIEVEKSLVDCMFN
ncbi:MAG TPA: hypothetical protein VLC71_06965 [Thermomonas sp.]|nr:hypothetical protein [Thermomonas sp.]